MADKIKQFNCAILLILLVIFYGQADAGEPKEKPSRLTAFQQIGFDAEYAVTAPKRIDEKDYIAVGTVALAAGVLYAEKKDINKRFQKNRTNTTDNIADLVKPLGNVFVDAAIAGTFYTWGLAVDSSREKETGVMLAESLVYTGVLTGAGQFIFAEDRPSKGGDMHFFKVFGHGVSAHAALSASVAGPLNSQYLQISPDADTNEKFLKYTGKVVVYGLPVLTGLSRINDNEHYAWNVLLGSVIGYTMGELVAEAHEKSKEISVAVAPLIDGDTKGAAVSFNF